MTSRKESRVPLPGVPGWRALAARGLLWPWMDSMTLRLIVRWHLPLSRAWASALASEGSLAAFWDGVGLAEPATGRIHGRTESAVAAVLRRAAAYREAEAAWQAAFFGPHRIAPGHLAGLQVRRVAAAEALMLSRGRFLGLHFRYGLPSLRWQVATPEAVEADHGRRLADPVAAFPAIEDAEVSQSQATEGRHGALSWIRFPAPLGDTAWARMTTPRDVADPPTLIFLHGITIETEMWRDSLDPVGLLARQGIRVIRPEGPWHGRRCPPGYYGGEPILGRGPLGLLDLFRNWVAETSAWIAWARRTSRGPVAVGGISLGALTGQLVLTAARSWPESQRPDAALLMAGSGDLLATGYEGALPTALEMRPRLAAAGWDEAKVGHWLPLLEPQGRPAPAPERILMLIGRADEVAPAETALALARCWELPDANVLLRRHQGHFTLDLGVTTDPGPLLALARLLKSL